MPKTRHEQVKLHQLFDPTVPDKAFRPLTRTSEMRRRAGVLTAAVLALGGLAAIAYGRIDAITADAPSGDATYVVQPGDKPITIARSFAPDASSREINALSDEISRQVNSDSTPGAHPGDQVTGLPTPPKQ